MKSRFVCARINQIKQVINLWPIIKLNLFFNFYATFSPITHLLTKETLNTSEKMRKLKLLLCLTITTTFLLSCSKDDDGDVEKVIEMTIYPETGYSGYVMSEDVYGEFLCFSESDSNEKKVLTDGGGSLNNFDYEKGYEYKIRAKKTFLKNPPQDASSIRYDYIETLSQEKIITENSEQNIEIEVAPEKIGFIPRSGNEIEQALFVRKKGEDKMQPLLNIEGFDYEEGYKYRLSVKKVIQADPYSVRYILLEILSKKDSNGS